MVREYVAAGLTEPDPRRKVELLHSLRIHRCVLCGMHFMAYKHDDDAQLNPTYVVLERQRDIRMPGRQYPNMKAYACWECAKLLRYESVPFGSRGQRWKAP